MTAEHLSFWILVKNSSYCLAFVASLKWLGFNPETIVIFGMLMFMDVVTALLRVSLNEGPRAIKSSPLKRGLISKFLLSAGLFCMALGTKGVGFDFQLIAQGFLNVLILGELYSILGNIHSARTGEPKSEWDAVGWGVSLVKKLIDKVIK